MGSNQTLEAGCGAGCGSGCKVGCGVGCCGASCPPFDITGCCPPNPNAQSISCTIFGCHACNGTERGEHVCHHCTNPSPTCDSCKHCPKRHVKKQNCNPHKPVTPPKKVVVVPGIPCCKEKPVVVKCCPPLPPPIVKCVPIFPGDLQEDLCRCEFVHKLKTCEPYRCFAPSSQNPSVRTTWEIHGKSANRCVISSTTDYVGLTDKFDRAVPITLTCEYDAVGINALIKRFNDMDKKYYHFTTCERGVGMHNCTITSDGKPLRAIRFK